MGHTSKPNEEQGSGFWMPKLPQVLAYQWLGESSPSLQTLMHLEAPRVCKAVSFFARKRPSESELTISLRCRLISTSRVRERAIVDAQIMRQNMIAKLLHTLEENPKAKGPKNDGALVLISQALEERAAGKRKGTIIQVIQGVLSSTYATSDGFSEHNFPLPGNIRQIIFQRVAIMIWRWYSDTFTSGNLMASKNKKKNKKTLNVDEIQKAIPPGEAFQRWKARIDEHQKAQATKVPFGKHRGKTFEEVGKGNIRWLREHVLPLSIVKETIEHCKRLLSPQNHTPTEVLAAKRAYHPYLKAVPGRAGKTKHQKSPRKRHINQQMPSLPGKTIRLGELPDRMIRRLHQEMREQEIYAPQYATISKAIDLFLAPRLPRFSVVDEVATDDQHIHQREKSLSAIRAFRKPIHSDIKDNADLREQWERKMQADLLSIDSSANTVHLHPIEFGRVMRPETYDGSAVLFDRETGQFLLAIAIHGQRPPTNGGKLHFATAPGTVFNPPVNKSMLLFPMMTGIDYHNEILAIAVEEAAIKQLEDYAKHPSNTKLSDTIPEHAVIGPARVSTQTDAGGHVQVFASLPITISAPLCINAPKSLMAIHEDDDGRYHVMVVSLIQQQIGARHVGAGDIVAMGMILIPPWADPKIKEPGRAKDKAKAKREVEKQQKQKSYEPDHYANNLVAAIVQLAQQHNAYICMEDTLWKKENVSVSRNINRRIFSRPSAHIATVLTRKALQAGLVEPRSVSNVSPYRDCGFCGTRLPKHLALRTSTIRKRCPVCNSKLELGKKSDNSCYCPSCKITLPSREQWFTCGKCKSHQVTPVNTSMVVAHRAITQILSHHEKLQKKELRIRKRNSKRRNTQRYGLLLPHTGAVSGSSAFRRCARKKPNPSISMSSVHHTKMIKRLLNSDRRSYVYIKNI
jgi:hypothetical protein